MEGDAAKSSRRRASCWLPVTPVPRGHRCRRPTERPGGGRPPPGGRDHRRERLHALPFTPCVCLDRLAMMRIDLRGQDGRSDGAPGGRGCARGVCVRRRVPIDAPCRACSASGRDGPSMTASRPV